MSMPSQRNETKEIFLKAAGWAHAKNSPLAGDASTRSYERLRQGDKRALLMIAPPGAEAPSCPKGATVEERKALGYNATARLAGPNLYAFISVANALRSAGLSAPEIYAADPVAGFALIEDLGDDLFARIAGKVSEETLYCTAIDALVALREASPERPKSDSYAMLDYDAAALEAEIELLIDWYWPLKKGSPADAALRAEHEALWRPLLSELTPPHSFVLRDYHAENILWLPDRELVQRAGVIDFQDALYGSSAYDVVSLLEDARRDVDPTLAEEMIVHYAGETGVSGGFDDDGFFHDFAILAAQRNAKILGIFARLAKRDNKPRYLDLLPRVEAHFRRDLKRPGLEKLAQFYASHFPEFAS